MNLPNRNVNKLNFVKILFSIRKEVRFGQAIYVCGNLPQLGSWQPQNAFRLRWNQGNIWTGVLLLTNVTSKNFEFKYIIAQWDNPSSTNCEWQVGSYNRVMDLIPPNKTLVCDDQWNMQKITLLLYITKKDQDNYLVTGNLAQLGAWKQPKKMKRAQNSGSLKENLNYHTRNPEQEQECYTYSFYTFRLNSDFKYYYIRKGETTETQRKPGRIFKFQNQHLKHPQRRSVTHPKGQITIHDNCSLKALKFSQVTSQIFVGSYPKTSADLEHLKQHNISAIFSIQSQRDYRSHNLSPHYFKLLCQEHNIKFKKYAIEDMDDQDFISRAEGGVKVFSQLMKDGAKVYIHCSAGIYRSPQMIVLYLTLFKDYTLENALDTVRDHHPFARPNSEVIKETIGAIQTRNRKYKLYAEALNY